MKTTLATTVITTTLLLTACGNTSTDGELVGQAKKFTYVTPLICEDYPAFDVSLGIMRNGSGSMSTQDMWFVVTNLSDIEKLRQAAETAAIVKIHYDTRRFAPCSDKYWMTNVEIVK
jgi:hypothetical protein